MIDKPLETVPLNLYLRICIRLLYHFHLIPRGGPQFNMFARKFFSFFYRVKKCIFFDYFQETFFVVVPGLSFAEKTYGREVCRQKIKVEAAVHDVGKGPKAEAKFFVGPPDRVDWDLIRLGIMMINNVPLVSRDLEEVLPWDKVISQNRIKGGEGV